MIEIREDLKTDSLVFTIPKAALDRIPEFLFREIILTLGKQYCEQFGDEIKKSIDIQKVIDGTVEKSSNHIAESISEFIKNNLNK